MIISYSCFFLFRIYCYLFVDVLGLNNFFGFFFVIWILVNCLIGCGLLIYLLKLKILDILVYWGKIIRIIVVWIGIL